MSENYLQHYGILGMKWGKRNGPPYPLTGKQMSSSERKAKRTGSKYVNATPPGRSSTKSASEMTTQELKDYNTRKGLEKQYNKYQNSNLEKTRQMLELANNSVNSANRTAEEYFRDEHKRKKQQIDLSHLSDDELRKIVNRLNLEKQYRDLTPDEITKGEVAVKTALGVLGTVTTTALLAFAVYKTFA